MRPSNPRGKDIRQYLKELEENNRLQKELNRKSEDALAKERLERGFNTYFGGANDDVAICPNCNLPDCICEAQVPKKTSSRVKQLEPKSTITTGSVVAANKTRKHWGSVVDPLSGIGEDKPSILPLDDFTQQESTIQGQQNLHSQSGASTKSSDEESPGTDAESVASEMEGTSNSSSSNPSIEDEEDNDKRLLSWAAKEPGTMFDATKSKPQLKASPPEKKMSPIQTPGPPQSLTKPAETTEVTQRKPRRASARPTIDTRTPKNVPTQPESRDNIVQVPKLSLPKKEEPPMDMFKSLNLQVVDSTTTNQQHPPVTSTLHHHAMPRGRRLEISNLANSWDENTHSDAYIGIEFFDEFGQRIHNKTALGNPMPSARGDHAPAHTVSFTLATIGQNVPFGDDRILDSATSAKLPEELDTDIAAWVPASQNAVVIQFSSPARLALIRFWHYDAVAKTVVNSQVRTMRAFFDGNLLHNGGINQIYQNSARDMPKATGILFTVDRAIVDAMAPRIDLLLRSTQAESEVKATPTILTPQIRTDTVFSKPARRPRGSRRMSSSNTDFNFSLKSLQSPDVRELDPNTMSLHSSRSAAGASSARSEVEQMLGSSRSAPPDTTSHHIGDTRSAPNSSRREVDFSSPSPPRSARREEGPRRMLENARRLSLTSPPLQSARGEDTPLPLDSARSTPNSAREKNDLALTSPPQSARSVNSARSVYSSPPDIHHTLRGRYLVLSLMESWGDNHSIGLNGIAILTLRRNGRFQEVFLDVSQISLIPLCPSGERSLRNLVNGSNDTCTGMDSWAMEFVPGEEHLINIDLGSFDFEFVGFRIWNYNVSQKTSRGVKRLGIELDGLPLSGAQGVFLEQAPGVSTLAFAQTLLAPFDKIEGNLSKSYATSTLQASLRSGSSIRVDLLSTFTHVPRIGLDGCKVLRADGSLIPCSTRLVAPFDDEPSKELGDGKGFVVPLGSNHALCNSIYISLGPGEVASKMVFFNNSKAPSQGVKSIAIYIDDILKYEGQLLPYESFSNKNGQIISLDM